MSAIFRAYNDWLADFCRADPARLKGIAMINVDDIPDAIRELERAASLGLAGALITEYPFEDRRYDQAEYEPFWAAALGLPLSLHTATRRQGQDPWRRRHDAARRQQPRDEGVLSGAVDVRPDLLRRLRTSSPPDSRHRGVRIGLGAPRTLHHGLHLPRAPRRGDLPVQGRYAPERFFRRNVYWASRRTPSAFGCETSSA